MNSIDNPTALLKLVSLKHQPALQKAIDFAKNPTQETAESVVEFMEDLFEIKQNMKKREQAIKPLDDIIKFAVRSTAKFPKTQHFFDIKPALRIGKVENSTEMFSRLLKLFSNPMDFSSCVKFDFNALKNLMGDNFIKDNSDIISEKIHESAVCLHKKE